MDLVVLLSRVYGRAFSLGVEERVSSVFGIVRSCSERVCEAFLYDFQCVWSDPCAFWFETSQEAHLSRIVIQDLILVCRR